MKTSLRPLFIICVIDVLGFGILIPLVPYMAERFGIEPQLITPILGAYSLCQLIAAPLWGRLSDRYGRRPILMLSLAGACVSYVMLGFAENVWWLLASRVLAGFMAGNLSAAFAYASDVSEPHKRAASMGIVGAAIGVGFMIGPAVGGVLAGDNVNTANFVLPAAVSACLSIVAIMLVWLKLPESHDPRAQPGGRGSVHRFGPLRLLRERPGLRLIALAALCVTCSQAILESIFAIWALARFGFGPRTVGLIMFALAFVAVAMQAGLVRMLVPRFGEMRVAMFGVCAYVLGLLIVADAAHLSSTLFGLALCGLGVGAFNPSASSLASRQSLPGDRGAVMGTYQASTSLARVIGPFASGPIYAAFGPAAPFIAGACVTLPALLFVWRARPGATPDAVANES